MLSPMLDAIPELASKQLLDSEATDEDATAERMGTAVPSKRGTRD